jgi:hypothetical protein
LATESGKVDAVGEAFMRVKTRGNTQRVQDIIVPGFLLLTCALGVGHTCELHGREHILGLDLALTRSEAGGHRGYRRSGVQGDFNVRRGRIQPLAILSTHNPATDQRVHDVRRGIHDLVLTRGTHGSGDRIDGGATLASDNRRQDDKDVVGVGDNFTPSGFHQELNSDPLVHNADEPFMAFFSAMKLCCGVEEYENVVTVAEDREQSSSHEVGTALAKPRDDHRASAR